MSAICVWTNSRLKSRHTCRKEYLYSTVVSTGFGDCLTKQKREGKSNNSLVSRPGSFRSARTATQRGFKREGTGSTKRWPPPPQQEVGGGDGVDDVVLNFGMTVLRQKICRSWP